MPKKQNAPRKKTKSIRHPRTTEKLEVTDQSSMRGLFILIGVAACSLIWAINSTTHGNNSLSAGGTNLIASATKENIQECLTCEPHPAAEEEAPPFTDVPVSHQYYKAIKFLKEKGVVKGDPDGTFRPGDYLNRAEVMTMVTRALKIEPNDLNGSNCFDDVKTQWFAPYICYGKMRGWISGVTPTSFNPTGLVQRAEAWKIVLGGFAIKLDNEFKPEVKGEIPQDINAALWYAKYVYTIYNKGWLSAKSYDDPRELRDKFIAGDSEKTRFGNNHYFYQNFLVQRGEFAQMLYLLIHESAQNI